MLPATTMPARLDRLPPYAEQRPRYDRGTRES